MFSLFLKKSLFCFMGFSMLFHLCSISFLDQPDKLNKVPLLLYKNGRETIFTHFYVANYIYIIYIALCIKES